LAERVIYGSSRLGLNTNKVDVLDDTPEEIISLTVGNKLYEMSNHLGNVLTVINDIKIPISSGGIDVDGYLATVVSTADYSPFGVQLDERTESAESYRFGFNGMEKESDWSGEGNMYTTEFRMVDPRLGRWLSLDPLMDMFPWASPYSAFANNPIFFTDPYGLAPSTDYYSPCGAYLGTDGVQNGQATVCSGVAVGSDGLVYAAYSPYDVPSERLNDLENYFNELCSNLNNESEYNVFSSVPLTASSAGYQPNPTPVENYSSELNEFPHSPSQPNSPNLNDVDLDHVMQVVAGVTAANGMKTELIDAAVRYNYKSANSWREWRKLRSSQKNWRLNDALGKVGAKYLKVAKASGVAGAVLATGYNGYKMVNYYADGGTDKSVGIKFGIDAAMTVVGFFGPIGFAISFAYFAIDFATDSFGGYGKIPEE
jgi:RHS repeat-associated protein